MRSGATRLVLAVLAILCTTIVYLKMCREEIGTDSSQFDAKRGQAPPTSVIRRPSEAPKAAVRGRVVDIKGQVIRNALVCFTSPTIDPPTCLMAPTGTFEIDPPSEEALVIVATAEGYASLMERGSATVDLSEGVGESVTLVLQTAMFPISGVVHDVFGGTVEGALIYVEGGGGWLGFSTSNSNGEFSLSLAQSFRARVHVKAEGYSDAEFIGRAPSSGIDITLEPTATLAGTVVDRSTRSAVPNATVFANAASPNETNRRVVSGPDGNFRLTGLRPGRYRPIAESAGRRGTTHESLVVGVGQTIEDLLIETDAAGQIHAKVLSADDRSPVDATVFLRTNTAEFSAKSDNDGALHFPAVWAGEYSVDIRAPGRIAPEPPPALLVAEAGDYSVEWLVGRGGVIKGLVADSQSKPIGKAIIRGWFPESLDKPNSRVATVSHEDGTFLLEGLIPYGMLLLHASHEGYIHDAPLEFAYTEARTIADVNIVLERAAVVEGSVLDLQGGASRALVLLYDENSPLRTRQSRVDEFGHFMFGELGPGTYRLVAGPVDSSVANPPVENGKNSALVVLESGERRAAIELTVSTEAGDIHGVVTDSSASGRPGVIVTAQSQQDVGFLRRTVTGDDGRFQFLGLADDRYVVRAYDDSDARAEVSNIRPNTEVTLKFEELASICGQVEGLENAQGEYRVRVSGQRNFFNINDSFPARQSRWCVQGIVPGATQVVFRYGDSVYTRDVVLAPGDTKELTFVLMAYEPSMSNGDGDE